MQYHSARVRSIFVMRSKPYLIQEKDKRVVAVAKQNVYSEQNKQHRFYFGIIS